MNGNVWAWGHWMEHTAAKGLSAWTVLMAPILAGHQDPSTSVCSFTRHPDLEKKSNEETLMTHRGGTGWRRSSLSAAQGYKEAYPKSVHGYQPKKNPRDLRRTSQLASLHPPVIAGPNVWTRALQCWVGSLITTASIPHGRTGLMDTRIPVLLSKTTPWGCQPPLKVFHFNFCFKKPPLSPQKVWHWCVLPCW